ncbi:MAG: serine hydrolase [Ardenticatenales bacterium]
MPVPTDTLTSTRTARFAALIALTTLAALLTAALATPKGGTAHAQRPPVRPDAQQAGDVAAPPSASLLARLNDRAVQTAPDQPKPAVDAIEAALAAARAKRAVARAGGAAGADGIDGAAQADPYAAIDACMADEMTAKGVPGAQVAVMLDGALTYAKGYGLKRADAADLVDADTLFRIGSVTKMMSAAGLMQQVEQGKVDLKKPLGDALPGFAIAGAWDSLGVGSADVTPWHLLTHSSAFPDNVFLTTGGIAGPTAPGSLQAWVAGQVTTTLHAPPGKMWNYSNPNFSLVGATIEQLSGMSYPDYMRQHIWGPAAMTETMLLPSEAAAYGDTSFGHYLDTTTGMPRIDAIDSYDNAPAAPAGYAFSTTKDLVKWADLLMRDGGGVIAPASVAAMTSRQMDLAMNDVAYGFGIFVERADRFGLDPILSHGGNIPGWGAYVIWVPQRRFAVATLGNTTASMDRTAGCALVNVLGLIDPPQPGPTATPAPTPTEDVAAIARYAGDYKGMFYDGSVVETRVALSGTVLVATLVDAIGPGQDYVTVLPHQQDHIFGFDINGDNVSDLSLDFLDASGAPAGVPPGNGAPRWMRTRIYVATYQGPVVQPTAGAPTPTPGSSETPGAPTVVPTAPPATPTAVPTAMPTAVPTALPTALPTSAPTAGPTAKPTLSPDGPILCPQVEARVPAAILAAAIANPQSVGGYDQLCRRNLPAGPYNGKRRALTLLNNAMPYHPLYNPLTFQCGCR